MTRSLLVGASALLCLAAAPARAELTLEGIMADPDWIGGAVEQPYWAADGTAVYYKLKRQGSTLRDLHRVGVTDAKDATLAPADMAAIDGASLVFDNAHRRAAFVRNGDVFVRDLASRRLIQVTRSDAEESAPQFCADDRCLQFRAGNDWFVHDFDSGVTYPAATLKTEKNPDDKKPGEMEQLQLRLIATLKKDHDDKEAQKRQADELRAADPTRTAKPYFLGDDVVIADTALSPDGRRLLVVTTPKGFEAGREGKMPKYVTESGYEETEDARVRVGHNAPAPQTLWLLDLVRHETVKLSYEALPGIKDDPLAAIRAENDKVRAEREKKDQPAPLETKAGKGKGGKDKDADKKKEPAERELNVPGMVWSRDGRHAAIQLRSVDNKDRWIVSLDDDARTLALQHRLTDAAWINWNFNEMGWLPDSRTLWYVSEETGYAQLYVKRGNDKAKALTAGQFEVSEPVASRDGQWVYV